MWGKQMRNRIKHIENWEKLLEFIESVNPYKQTIVLEGWINKICDDRVKINSLIFSTKPVELLTLSDKDIQSKGINIIARITTKKDKK